MIYVGVDLHLRFCYMTVLDANGKILQQGRVENVDSALQQFFTNLKSSLPEKTGIAAAVEACGVWCAFVDCVEPLVERVVLVHPAKVKAIAHAKLKNDRQLQKSAQQDPDARCLLSIPGIGAFSAMVLKA